MKRIYLSLILFVACVAVSAQKVSESEALQKAQLFMKDKQFTTTDKAHSRRLAPRKAPGYYVFNAEDGGFVIVAGDERMPEILGYSDHGQIDEASAPCGLKWLLGCYEQMAKNAESNNINPSRSRTRSDKAPVAPFVSTTWGQSTPYNAMCPRVDGAKCVTGCVATAMAQIMNYYCWPNEVTEPIPAYTSYTNKVSMPQLEPTTFTWGYLNKTNLSKLMLYCGQAVEMNYDPEESGAGVPDEALKKYFSYDESLRLVSREEFSDETWDNLLYEEMANLRPVYYFGYDGISGHAFVLCGYQDNHFYINWGWDGGGDGFFILDGISPSVGAYNDGQGAVIGIKPKGEPTPVKFYPRRIVMENKAWANNGEYVVGIETFKRLKEVFPNNFIGIDTHVADPMEEPENYEYMTNKYGGVPCGWVNRVSYVGSYYSDIRNLVEVQKNKAYADIEASATYAKPDKSAIMVKTGSTFGFNSKDEDLRLAFVLVEDHVGPYTQNNNFYSNPNAPDNPDYWLNDWVHKGSQVEMLFDDVARGIYGDAQGIENSLPSTIEKDKVYLYDYTFNVPTLQNGWGEQSYNKDNFRIVVLLIDKSTGEILNACQTKIDYDASVESQTFEFKNNSKRLVPNEVVSWKSKGVADGNLVLGTNLKADGLTLTTFDSKQASGTATLEVLTNTFGSPTLTWGMGSEAVTITGDSQTISFTTNARGEAEIKLKASNISQFGIFEAKLTATISGVSQSVIIKFIHQQTDVLVGDDIELSEGQAWWNNATVGSSYKDEPTPIGYMQGTQKEERYSVATYIPAHLFGDKIPTICGIGFPGATTAMSNIKVWISSYLPANGEAPDIASISYPEDAPLVIDRFNDVVFRQQYQIPEGGVYVGYSFDIVDMRTFRSHTPIMFSDKTRDNALWVKTESMPEWIDRFDDLQGNLQLRILWGGNVMKKNAMTILQSTPVTTLVGADTHGFLQVTNEGTESITSLEYEIKGKTYDCYQTISPGEITMFCPVVEVESEPCCEQRIVTITKVNGVPNESDQASATFPVYTIRQSAPATAVLEEFTATWCGWSPQAALAIDKYQEQFGDKLITICTHENYINEREPWLNANDPMTISEYAEVRDYSQGMYPTCIINRAMNEYFEVHPMDPYMGWGPGGIPEPYGVSYKIEESLSQLALVEIEVGTLWSDDNKNMLTIQTRTTFELNASELPFQIGYVLLEDGMKGEGREWAQYNTFSGIEELADPRMEELAKLPEWIEGYIYNNVVVAAWDAYKGVPGSLVGPFKAGVPVEGSFVADIKGNTLIQNKENLNVVALIVNKETGKIINAAKCKIGDTLPPSAINGITTSRAVFDIYNLQGSKVRSGATSLDGLPKGVYIVDGRKVIK